MGPLHGPMLLGTRSVVRGGGSARVGSGHAGPGAWSASRRLVGEIGAWPGRPAHQGKVEDERAECGVGRGEPGLAGAAGGGAVGEVGGEVGEGEAGGVGGHGDEAGGG